MKKLLAIILLLCLVMSMVGCTKEGESGTLNQNISDTVKVGFGRTNITPKESVPLDSYGDAMNRFSTGYMFEMYANAVAIQDTQGNILLMMSSDLSWGGFTEEVNNQITAATGIPDINIVHCGTHTHSGVATGTANQVPAVARWNQLYITNVVQAAIDAVNDLSPAEAYIGSAQTQSLNFVRRYMREDGTIKGDNFGYANPDGTVNTSPIIGHETEADHEVQVIQFVREGKKDVVLTNFQCHPHLEGKTFNASSESWGAYRDYLESQLDVYCTYFNGAAGNINNSTYIAEEKIVTTHRVWGELLAGYVIAMQGNMEKVEVKTITATTETYTGKVNHTEDDKVRQAQEIVAMFKNGSSPNACSLAGAKYGIHSYYHAAAIIEKRSQPETKDVVIRAIAIGDIGIVTVPYEMYDTNGMFIKDNSPFKMTFICGYNHYKNGNMRYIPSELGYTNGGYEADNSWFMKGTAEELADLYVKMLNDLYAKY